MPGHIIDPNLNSSNHEAKEYGFLMNAEDGHIYMYLKDKDSQFFTHGTPVNMGGTLKVSPINNGIEDVYIEVYTAITVDKPRVDSYNVVKRMNEFAGAPSSEIEDMVKKSGDVKNLVTKFPRPEVDSAKLKN